MIQLDKTWVRWGIAFGIITLLLEGAMLRAPVVSTAKASVEQEWSLPTLMDRSSLLALSDSTANHLAWGLQSEEDVVEKANAWQLKGIVKAGSELLALVSVSGKLSRVRSGDQVLGSTIESIREGGVTVTEIDEKGIAQTRFVKILR